MIKEALDVWMWMFNIGLSGNEVLIYAYIYDCSSRGRVFTHSYQEIADSIGSSEQTVWRAIDKMLKLGAIKTCINPKDGQRVFVHSADYIKDVKKTDYTL